jgi:hypothetical protein
VVEDLDVLGEHSDDGFDVFVAECVGESLSEALNLC